MASETHQLTGKWAVVTGGSKGIGFGIAEALHGAGANVVIVARSADELDAAKNDLMANESKGAMVLTTVADVSRSDSIDAMFAFVDAHCSSLDVFVANAGFGTVVPFLDITLDNWQAIMDLNLTGTFLCMQGAARRMARANTSANTSGTASDRSIVVVSSIRADGVRPGRAVYAATKAAINQLARVAAYELAASGVRVNVIAPGITATPLALEGNPALFAEMAATVPLGRAGDINDMGAAALYLASPQSKFVTGTVLTIDGGESLW